jgi:Zn-dependent peptidase ImmA (M78 family)
VPNPEVDAQETLQTCGISSIPVDVEAVARHLGAKVIYKDTFDDDLCGMLYREGSDIIIGVNKSHFPYRQRFTIAHEIGHLVMHSHIINQVHVDRKFTEQLKRDKRASLGLDRIEIEANRFAAELLMPTAELLKAVDDRMDIENGLTQLADEYEVSVQAMTIKLARLFPDLGLLP